MEKITKKDTAYFQSLSYDIVIRKKGLLKVLLIPELSIVVQDESLDKAYARLESEKEAYFRQMINVSMENYICEPQNQIFKETLIDKLTPFFIKLIAISLALVIFTTVGVEFIKIKINDIQYYAVVQVRHLILYTINEMPEERRDRIRIKLRKAVSQIKPFVDEIKILFIENEDNKTSNIFKLEK